MPASATRSATRPRRRPARTAGAPPARRGTLAARVHADLTALLTAGMLEPGQKLSLRSIADRLGVSVQPVREAVSKLVADRALAVLPNRAVRVPLMTLAQFRELTAIRLVIEGYAAERAAGARSAVELAAMRRHDAAFRREREAARPDLGRAIAANQALHFTVYRAAGFAELLPIIEGLWLRIGPVINLDLRAVGSRERLAKSARCHARMVAAIEARRGPAARRALEDDVRGAAEHIMSRGVLPERT